MIYYPLSTLMLGGIREILIITTPKDRPCFENLLGDGSRLGLRLEYAEQAEPRGIAEAFIIGEPFLAGEGCSLILGDNLFYGNLDFFRQSLNLAEGACIFGYPVKDPQRFGIVEFDRAGNVLSLEEKPSHPRSHFAVPGLYIYDGEVSRHARDLAPSHRGELEITDLNRRYHELGRLRCEPLGRGLAWLDTGTPESLLEASNYIAAIESQQRYKIACLEEVAFNRGFIDQAQFRHIIEETKSPCYRSYLEMVLQEYI
jgi:glucose-1-phosphate thymidylyltransferase